jgi:asparagine synthase (glutamine-hydrolysing)
MSAVFGVLRFDGADVAAGDLERMSNIIAHRGPDGRKFAAAGPAGLGHCLMRVNQEDLFEVQPLRDGEADLMLVTHCRIDNREALAATLGISSDRLRDMPDSALVLRAYRQWGEAAPEHLLGDFTFAVWDGRAGKLVLARDHMGQRPLFYHHNERFFAFASEIKALWALEDVPRQLDEAAIGQMLAPMGDVVAPGGTLYADIFGLAGGTVMTIDRAGRQARRCYWEPHADPAHENRDEAYYIATYREVMEEAVACRLRRLLRPAALLLSGGFDSAAIAGLAGPVVTAQGRKLITVSAVVSESHLGTKYDIRPWIEACKRVMPHLDSRLTPELAGSPLDALEKRFLFNDGMAGVPDYFNYSMFAEAANAGVRLLMDGIGGDYGINPRGGAALANLLARGKFLRFLAELGPHMRVLGMNPLQLLRHELAMKLLPRRMLRWLRFGSLSRLDDYVIDSLFASRLLAEGRTTKARAAEDIPATAMRAESRRLATLVCRLPAHARVTPAAAFGLEFTRPLHDKRVIEFGLALPEDLYAKRGRNRHLARTALRDVYPPELQSRGRANDPLTPDFAAILDAAMPELLAESHRLAGDPALARYIDFKKLPALLSSARARSDDASLRTRWFALRGLLLARHMEWFTRRNRY